MADVNLRLTQLQQAVAAGGELFSSALAQRAYDDLELAHERMRVGEGFVVAALVGGTGSGKSTLFNRLTELGFAKVSETRPTTEEIMACTWGGDSSELLNVLNVRRRNRIQHESLLTAGNERHDALVLLDTPDYDSVNLRNSGKVSQLLPLLDVVLWVLDPQKYAEAEVYHSLITMGRRHEHGVVKNRDRHTLLVVVNRIDTIPEQSREAVLADVRTRINELGFSDVPIIATSALYGWGIEELDRALGKMTADRSLWHTTAQAQLDSVADLLSSQVGESEAQLRGGALEDLSTSVAEASGVDTVAEAIRSGRGEVHIHPEAPAPTLSVALRDMWVTQAIEGLPEPWQAAVEHSIPGADVLRKRISAALKKVEIPSVRSVRVWPWWLAGALVACIGCVCGLWALADMQLWVRLLCGGIGIIAGAVVVFVGIRRAKKARLADAKEKARAYIDAMRASIRETLADVLLPGPEAILKRHRAARTLIQGE